MTKNVGTLDRALRLLGATVLLLCAFAAPVAAALRLPLFGGLAAYLAVTALAGTCLGYTVMGRSTCAVRRR